MRNNYPISSQELNDKLFSMYENIIYILGIEKDNILYDGLSQKIDDILDQLMINECIPIDNNDTSNIENSTDDLITIFKFDYIFRKNRGLI